MDARSNAARHRVHASTAVDLDPDPQIDTEAALISGIKVWTLFACALTSTESLFLKLANDEDARRMLKTMVTQLSVEKAGLQSLGRSADKRVTQRAIGKNRAAGGARSQQPNVE